MKLISEQDFKKVDYFGLELFVPTWTKSIASDSTQDVWVFSQNPVRNDYCWMYRFGCARKIATVDLEGLDWKETLVEVEG